MTPEESPNPRVTNASLPAGCGCYLVGAPVASFVSFTINHSVAWSMFHSFFWWAYLPYVCAGSVWEHLS